MGDGGDPVLAQLLAQVDTTDVAVPGQYQRKGLRTRALRKEKAGAAADDDKAQGDLRKATGPTGALKLRPGLFRHRRF